MSDTTLAEAWPYLVAVVGLLAHGCVCAVAGQASRYWPEGADASVPIPRKQVVPAKTVTGTTVDAPCVETWARLEAGEQLGMCQ